MHFMGGMEKQVVTLLLRANTKLIISCPSMETPVTKVILQLYASISIAQIVINGTMWVSVIN